MSNTDKIKRDVYYSGHVQGVGFRYTVRSLAARFEVTGFVRNLSDGRVEVVVEGESAEVGAFLADIKAEMNHYISDIIQEETPASGRFKSFDIKF